MTAGGVRVVPRKPLKTLRRVVLPGGRVVSCITLKSQANSEAGGVHISKDIGGRMRRPPNLEDLAERIERLVPSPRHPDRFHEEKSDIVEMLRILADEARRG